MRIEYREMPVVCSKCVFWEISLFSAASMKTAPRYKIAHQAMQPESISKQGSDSFVRVVECIPATRNEHCDPRHKYELKNT